MKKIENRRNKNRGYRNLRVWKHSVDLYAEVVAVCRHWPFDMKRLASQTMASTDSVHRNIAEGYCRRSLKEYLQFVNYALGSLGETGSAILAYEKAGQISEEQANKLDERIYQFENELLSLNQSLLNQSADKSTSQVRESSAAYKVDTPDFELLVNHLENDLTDLNQDILNLLGNPPVSG